MLLCVPITNCCLFGAWYSLLMMRVVCNFSFSSEVYGCADGRDSDQVFSGSEDNEGDVPMLDASLPDGADHTQHSLYDYGVCVVIVLFLQLMFASLHMLKQHSDVPTQL